MVGCVLLLVVGLSQKLVVIYSSCLFTAGTASAFHLCWYQPIIAIYNHNASAAVLRSRSQWYLENPLLEVEGAS